MAADYTLTLVPAPGTALDDPATLDYLPFGTRTLKVAFHWPEGRPPATPVWVRPLTRHPTWPDLAVGVVDGSGADSPLWLHWGGGHLEGVALNPAGSERFAFFNVLHRGALDEELPVTLGAFTAAGNELARATFRLQRPEGAAAALQLVWTPAASGSSLAFAGERVPDYLSRWWPPQRVRLETRRPPALRLRFPCAPDHSAGPVEAMLDDVSLLRVGGRLERALHDLRLFDADLFHFYGGRYWVLRLWFAWLHTRFRDAEFPDSTPRPIPARAAIEEVPDAERIDLLFDARQRRVQAVGTDLHWRESWGDVLNAPPVTAEVLPLGLKNATYALLRFNELQSTAREPGFDPAQELLQRAAAGFPRDRAFTLATLLKKVHITQAHAPYISGLRPDAALTSGAVKVDHPTDVRSIGE